MSEAIFQDESVLGPRFRVKVTEKVVTHGLPPGLAHKPVLVKERRTYFTGEGMTFTKAKETASLINHKYPFLKRIFGGFGARVVRENY